MFPLAHIYHLGIPTTLALILNIEIILTLTIRSISLKLSYSPIVRNPIKTKPHSYTKIASPFESDLNKPYAEARPRENLHSSSNV